MIFKPVPVQRGSFVLILVAGKTNIWIRPQGVLLCWQLVLPGFPSMANVDGST